MCHLPNILTNFAFEMLKRKYISIQKHTYRLLFMVTMLIVIMVQSSLAQGKKSHTRRKAYPGGKSYMMRLTLRDKNGTTGSIQQPQAFLSAKAIERRQRQHLPIDSTDLPISQHYINDLLQRGLEIVAQSKWNNTIVVRDKSMQKLKSLAKLDFVINSKLVWRSPNSTTIGNTRMNYSSSLQKWDNLPHSLQGAAYEQTTLIGGDILADQGYKGRGKTIAVLDGGFMNVDRIEAFKKIDIAGTADMVYPNNHDIFKSVEHGTKVLSTMAICVPGIYTGTAPEASYWLIDCEDTESEQLVEEDYWAQAAEFADSVGVDIITSSLGYHEFDHKDMSHRYQDLDGHTTLISNTASMLAAKGIVAVVSAGNDGMGSWQNINVPADADNIITVGAVSPQRQIAAFSSIGPTADGRIKPDITACGSPAAVITGRGTIQHDIGTSFAAPQVAGLIACLWQKYPTLSAYDIINAVRQCADNASAPNNILGYGIPNFSKINAPK